MFLEKEFISESSFLRGRWYTTSDSSKAPCLVMCHGTSVTITMCLSDYTLEFQKKGFNVFLYDHAGFVRSDGKNPLTIYPWLQSRGIAGALTYVKSEDHAHNGKIILWGDSFAGMLVLVVSTLIEDLAGVVSFTASCGFKVLNFENPKESFERLKEIFNKCNFDQLEDWRREGPKSVVSHDQEASLSLLTPIQAFKWFIDQGGQWNSNWENRVTRVIPKIELPFSPLLTAPFTCTCTHDDRKRR